MADLNVSVVLAALNDMLEPMTTHRMTHLSIMRLRVKRLRDHVAQYVDPPGATSTRAPGDTGNAAAYVAMGRDEEPR